MKGVVLQHEGIVRAIQKGRASPELLLKASTGWTLRVIQPVSVLRQSAGHLILFPCAQQKSPVAFGFLAVQETNVECLRRTPQLNPTTDQSYL